MIKPIPMVLFCPHCSKQHIDALDAMVDWPNMPHRSHLCAYCKFVWRPADAPTVGVATLQTKGVNDGGILVPLKRRVLPDTEYPYAVMFVERFKDGKCIDDAVITCADDKDLLTKYNLAIRDGLDCTVRIAVFRLAPMTTYNVVLTS